MKRNPKSRNGGENKDRDLKQLNLPKQFGSHAEDLLGAVKKGRAAHAAGNIKSSGAPLEEHFRKILAASLPSTSKVASGYFYDAASNCSAEVDVMIYEDEEAFRLDPAPQDQHYVPHTSVSILGQIKNSSGSLANALQQVQGSIKAWNTMKRNLFSSGVASGQPYQFEPLTFVICGTSTDKDIAELKTTLEQSGAPYPNYIMFLDKGLIVAGTFDMLEFDEPVIDFLQYRSVNSLYLCRPAGPTEDVQGIALLWLYFALVAKLSLDKGNNLRYQAFCQQIGRLYPLRPFEKLL
jgi:hypothetical protein